MPNELYREGRIQRHLMEFFNPVYHSGLNTTVRLGPEWYDKCISGDEIEIVHHGEPNSAALAKARIIKVKIFVGINKIPRHLLKKHHDPACRTRKGLYYVLRMRFCSGLFVDERTMVMSVISFRI